MPGFFIRARNAPEYLPNPDHIGFSEAKMLLDIPPSHSYRITKSTLKVGAYAETHRHPWDHAYYVLQGHARIRIADQTFDAGPDSLVYVPANDLHSVHNVGKTPLAVLAVVGPASKYQVTPRRGRAR